MGIKLQAAFYMFSDLDPAPAMRASPSRPFDLNSTIHAASSTFSDSDPALQPPLSEHNQQHTGSRFPSESAKIGDAEPPLLVASGTAELDKIRRGTIDRKETVTAGSVQYSPGCNGSLLKFEIFANFNA